MEKLAVAFTVLFSTSAFAQGVSDTLDELQECESLCSAQCEQLASIIADAIDDYENACGNGGSCDKVAGFQACDSALASASEPICAGLVSQHCLSVEVIKACEKLGINDANEIACMQGAAPKKLSAEAVGACEDLGNADDNEIACVKAAGLGPLTADAVRACADLGINDANEIACVTIAGKKRLTAVEIQYCDQAGNGDDAELACLENF